MRSRVAITAILATGLVMSGGSVGLAISGLSGSGSAGVAAYPTETEVVTPQSQGGEESPEANRLDELGQGSAPGADPGEEDPVVQVARQAESDDRQTLPFTGLAAIPLLLAGIALTVTGVHLRRRLPDGSKGH
jgi:hypothetical protein